MGAGGGLASDGDARRRATARHRVEVRCPKWASVLGLGTIDQADPFHDSINVWGGASMVGWSRGMAQIPTAMHADGPLHDTPFSWLILAGRSVGARDDRPDRPAGACSRVATENTDHPLPPTRSTASATNTDDPVPFRACQPPNGMSLICSSQFIISGFRD